MGAGRCLPGDGGRPSVSQGMLSVCKVDVETGFQAPDEGCVVGNGVKGWAETWETRWRLVVGGVTPRAGEASREH